MDYILHDYLSQEESLSVLDSLKKSDLFWDEQYSYILYPNKELLGFMNKNIVPEETDTYELEVIYSPNFNNRLSLNIFYSDLYNVIDLEEESSTITGYKNYDSRTSKGIEFEYSFRTKLTHHLYFNADNDTNYFLYNDTFYKISYYYAD